MQKVFAELAIRLFNELLKNGLSLILLAVAVVYFHVRTENLEDRYHLCNERVIKMYAESYAQMETAINKNTIMMERNEAMMKEIQIALKIKGL